MMNIIEIFSSRDVRLNILNFLKFIPDKIMLRMEYRMKIGKKLHLKSPVTFNEKLQWLKLNDRKSIYTTMADKYTVREFIKEKIGEDYLVPIYGCWSSVDDIPFGELPNSFVLKCTHDSGSVIICKDKNNFDVEQAKNKLNKRLKKNAFWWAREWPYKNIRPRVIAEHYMVDGDNAVLPVYKIFCFNGRPKLIQQIQNDKQENETVDYFDIHWSQVNIKQRFPNSNRPVAKPAKLSEMLQIAQVLSMGTSFLRVDLYIINDLIYFSEHTFYTDAGYSAFEPEEWDKILGDWINISRERNGI